MSENPGTSRVAGMTRSCVSSRNMHEIEVEKEFGVLTAKTENLPPPVNSKTGYIAVLSAIVTLKKMTDPV
jgi:aspartate dehydrogenase